MDKTEVPDRRDLFISHASEDKPTVATPLAEAIIARSWSVWLDELELTVGDSLNTRINAALARSRFGVVILSPAFFEKRWPQRELDGLAAREAASGAKVILPVWHGINAEWLTKASPILADRVGVSTALGIGYVADKLVRALESARRSQAVDSDFDTRRSVLVPVDQVLASGLDKGSRDPLASWWLLPKAVREENPTGDKMDWSETRLAFIFTRKMVIPLAYTRNYRKVANALTQMAALDIRYTGEKVVDYGAPSNRSTMIAAMRQLSYDDPKLLAGILREAFEFAPRDLLTMCYEAGLPVPGEEFTPQFLRRSQR